MQIIEKNYNQIFFGKSKSHNYTAHQLKIMKDMKKAALVNDWLDIYTGKKFSKEMLPTIEHLVPCSSKKSNTVKQRIKDGFQIHGLENIFPVSSLGNSERQSQPFIKTILDNPKVLDRMLGELEKYRKYKSNLIDGETWFNSLYKTLTMELKGISSDIKTKKLLLP